MTATNHMLAGAVLATTLHNPLLVFPTAVVSHFLLDVLPHFGIKEEEHVQRNSHPLFRYILIIDITLLIALMALLPAILKAGVSRWVLMSGMFLAWAPDLVWVRSFFSELRHKTHFPQYSWFSRLHQRIQWFEKPWGIVTEVVWFGMMATLLGVLVA